MRIGFKVDGHMYNNDNNEIKNRHRRQHSVCVCSTDEERKLASPNRTKTIYIYYNIYIMYLSTTQKTVATGPNNISIFFNDTFSFHTNIIIFIFLYHHRWCSHCNDIVVVRFTIYFIFIFAY